MIALRKVLAVKEMSLEDVVFDGRWIGELFVWEEGRKGLMLKSRMAYIILKYVVVDDSGGGGGR
jgi:hypothetical protein